MIFIFIFLISIVGVGCSVFNTENRTFAETFAPKYQTLSSIR
jgi:hypothetical protein